MFPKNGAHSSDSRKCIDNVFLRHNLRNNIKSVIIGTTISDHYSIIGSTEIKTTVHTLNIISEKRVLNTKEVHSLTKERAVLSAKLTNFLRKYAILLV